MDAYLFDMGNVIVAFDHWRFCHRLAGETNRQTPDEIYTIVFQNGLNTRFELGQLNGKSFYQELKKALNFTLSMERVQELWCDIFWENPGMTEILKMLHTRARLILISNTNSWHTDYVQKRFNVLTHFHALILSYEIGVCKPDEQIFQAALSAAGTAPENCLYFDDSELNIQAARKIGIPSVLFRYDGPFPGNP